MIFGGKSSENEISIITGTMVINVLKNNGVGVLPLYVSQQGELFCGEELADINSFKSGAKQQKSKAVFVRGGVAVLKNNGKIKKVINIPCLINCCHGGGEEGGALAGVCAFCAIPFVGSGIFSSSAAINKYFTKLVLQSLKIKCAPWQMVRSVGDIPEAIKKIGLPLVVKPRNLGSSIGVVLANTEEDVLAAVNSALILDDAALLEKYLLNRREVNCAAYFDGERVITSECEEVISSGELLSYDDKYSGDGSACFPAQIPQEIANQIKATTQKVYSALEMRGIVRIDYIISGGEVYLCEINTTPGSLSQYLLTNSFYDFYKLLQKLVKVAVSDFEYLCNKNVINTGIINNLSTNACKNK